MKVRQAPHKNRLITAITASLLLSWSGLYAESFGPYKAKVLNILESDEIELEALIWPGLIQRLALGLTDIVTPHATGDTPNCEKEAAQRAMSLVRQFLAGAEFVTIDEIGLDSGQNKVSGKLSVDGKSLSEALLAAGLARQKSVYTKPWCEDPIAEQEERVYCASDVKRCPDGTFVSRQPPGCEFIPCP